MAASALQYGSILAARDRHWSYEDLLSDSSLRELDDLQVRVLSLEKLIEAKEITGREKDRAMLPVLRRTLALGET